MPLEYSEIDIAQEIADLPSDAFSSSPLGSEDETPAQILPQGQPQPRLVAPQNGLRQTTLFGGRAIAQGAPRSSQTNKVHNYIAGRPPEQPTHHALDLDELKTWVYPTNLGTIRAYQYSIVKNGLYNNTLVALPTGLGKTFIAATVMLNYFRWTKTAQIVFMAPTKPLVAQQIDACFNIAGIPRSTTTMLTGEINPGMRAEEWDKKRVFFMTPQTLENDLRSGIADPKKIVLLVIDEAHRATGNYAYVKVVELMRKFSKSFRILALTATPGSSVEAVQEVIDGLEISKTEIRTEDSIDIQPFVYGSQIEQILLDPSDEMIMVKDLFSKALQPLVDQLCGQNAYWNKDPMSLTPFGMVKARESWAKSDAGRRANPGLKFMVFNLMNLLAALAHTIKLLNFHGIGPFFHSIKQFRTEAEAKAPKIPKYHKQILDSPYFKTMMDRLQGWINKDDFIGHPKLSYLCDAVLNHFMDAGDGTRADGTPRSATRIIVFSEFRDSAEEIARVLNRHGPLVSASVFVGQADSKRSQGMNQATQIETISKFKKGIFNVIVATSIGEEGLDIGQVDLIICYDASASPIRMLQRMGRTGRKRAGNVLLLLMRGKEEESFMKAKDNYEQMQKMISDGKRFNYRHDLATRIVPREIVPEVDKRVVEIPLENTQDPSLPEPRRRNGKAKKRPPKKFNMPDDAETGFQLASRLAGGKKGASSNVEYVFSVFLFFFYSRVENCTHNMCRISPESEDEFVPIPRPEEVFLDAKDSSELDRKYLSVAGADLEISSPAMGLHPEAQRMMRPVKNVQHGRATKRFVKMACRMHQITEETMDRWSEVHKSSPAIIAPSRTSSPVPEDGSEVFPVLSSDQESENQELAPPLRPKPKPSKSRKWRQNRTSTMSDDLTIASSNYGHSDEEDEEDDLDGFVVRDDDPLGNELPISTLSPSPPPTPRPPRQTPFYEPTQFTATQDTNDDDIPDMEELLGKCKRVSRSPLRRTNTDDNVQQQNPRAKRRRVVEDSDSDY
jgi:ATP-dependent DNA helicase MPH1